MARRAGQAPLTRERILRTALELIDTQGMDALSMRRLGAELGVDAMAVYYHLPSKDAVVRAVVADLFANMPLPTPRGPWLARAREWARNYRALARAHPNLVLRIVADAATVAEAGAHIDAALHAAIADSGIDVALVSRGADVLVDYINGFVLAEASGTLEPEADHSFEFGLDLILFGVSRIAE
jgi:TetR/AcrR family tetracycline transcriptional repressor